MEYYIDEVRTRARANPNTFSVPDMADIEALEVGNFVKLILIPKDMPKDQFLRGERLWVQITERDGDLFWGQIDNDPFLVKAKIGDIVAFKADDIADIFIPPGGGDGQRKVRDTAAQKDKSSH